VKSPSDKVETEPANPFATRFTRPGALNYVFADGESAAALVSRLAELGWRAQILGPHGSGKSTLIAQLAEPLEHAGRRPAVFALHDGQRWLPRGWEQTVGQAESRLVVIDGYEQLGYLSRCWVAWRCRRRGWGLLVTAHQDVGFPTLIRTASSMPIAQAVVEQLLGGQRSGVDAQTVAECYSASGGNVREMLFALYDRHQKQCS
jgi:energy-coupling factor transporter ATP-binding protein EcfA2